MMKQLPVLIIGAGPTGLMMACELERYAIPFRIIDKKSEPTQGSNATWIQSRTLEIFELAGINDSFLRKGHKCEAINLYAHGKPLITIPLTQLHSAYPFILMLPQSETERLLGEKLKKSNITVERSLELIDVTHTKEGVVSTIKLPNGDTETITSDWLIACDGANSIVREKCHISFPGEDVPEQFMVADAKMSSFLPANEIHAFFDKGTIFPEKGTLFSAFPLGSKQYRLSANLYMESPRRFFTEREVREVVAERTYGNYVVDSVSWISPFWIHSKMAEKMQEGSIFLAGDAAHIHSPAGGQGMNAGIQDAFNLAWKLAFVIKKKASAALLNSYQQERLPVIKEIVNKTDFYTNMVLFDKAFSRKLKQSSRELLEHPQLSNKIAEQLTQLDICYNKSDAIQYAENLTGDMPKPGERAPDVTVDDGKKLSAYLSNSMLNIVLFTGNQLASADLEKILALQTLIENKFSDSINLFVITNHQLEKINHIIFDTTGAVHHVYHANHLSTYIIRPDQFIAYYSNGIELESLEPFLKKYLLMD
jgi:2-polyprenyl-6-methoxyphenol hydroxylase-like FAD-dependent oxidoreductase